MSTEAEIVAFASSVPSAVIAKMRCHARHVRQQQPAAPIPIEACMNFGCIRYRSRADFMVRLHGKVSGPRMLAAMLKISVREAGVIMLDGPTDDQMATLNAMLGGAGE